MHLTKPQLGPLYDKLKSRLYNALYHREKRLEAKYKGDKTKMREDLGFEVPVRIKRPRKSKENTTSTSPKDNSTEGLTKDDDKGVPVSSSPMHPVTLVEKDSTTEDTTGKDLRPEVRDTGTDSVNSIEVPLSLTSGINGTNSVAGSATSTTHAPHLQIQQSEVGIFFTTAEVTSHATPATSNARKNFNCIHT